MGHFVVVTLKERPKSMIYTATWNNQQPQPFNIGVPQPSGNYLVNCRLVITFSTCWILHVTNNICQGFLKQTEASGKSQLDQTTSQHTVYSHQVVKHTCTCISYCYWKSVICSRATCKIAKHTGISLGCGNCELTKICLVRSSETS